VASRNWRNIPITLIDIGTINFATMLSTEPQRPLYRIVAGLAGLGMISLGVAPILKRGDIFYTNGFGGLVFSPLAIIIGFFTVGCAVFKPSWLSATREARRKR
jgi:hypothetical protein